MDERQIGLALILKEAGIGNDVSGFHLRLILQKAVYLFEEAGIRLGYSFNWYLRGPYSPVLTRDLFGLASTNEDLEGWVLDERSRAIVERIKSLLETRGEEDLSSKARRLELLASLHYLSRRNQVIIDDPQQAAQQLAQSGKHFSIVDVDAAINCLKHVQLL